MNKVGNVNTKCPYFHSETGKKIYCSANMEGANIALCFTDAEKKEEYQENFCFTFCFKGCRIAQLIEEENGEV